MTRKSRVLIVEDEVVSAMLLERILKKDFEVCGNVVTGKEAVKTAARERPDALIIDIGLPGKIDGIETAREILAAWPMSVIFLTGYSDASIRERAEKLRPAAYLVKPVNFRNIPRLLHDVLSPARAVD